MLSVNGLERVEIEGVSDGEPCGNRGGTHGQQRAEGQAGNLDSTWELVGRALDLRLWYQGTKDLSRSSCGQSQLT